MNYVIEEEKGFSVVGPKIRVSIKNNENLIQIPKFWDESMKNGSFKKLQEHIGSKGIMGVCADFDPNTSTFDYYIAIEKPKVNLDYPELNIDDGTWIKFKGFGKIPYDFQKMVKDIPKWFEEHSEYARTKHPELELYSPITDNEGNCGFEIWIGVIKK